MHFTKKTVSEKRSELTKILTKSERFSEIVFLVKCIRGTYIRAECKNQRLFKQYK